MIRNLLLTLMIGALSFSFLITEAQAKRFGAGRSFGASRSVSSFSSNAGATASRAMPTSPASSANKWLGPLAGLAMGGLLASLFMGHGLGSGIMSWLLIAGVAFLVWGLIRARLQPAAKPANHMPFHAQNSYNDSTNNTVYPFARASKPSDFDEALFLRQSKALFIRLQAAYDNKNTQDIREFTSPEVFAEIQLQLQERGNEVNFTEVLDIDARLLDLTTEGSTTIASVLFSGQIREEKGATPTAINEVWHFHKDNFKTTWIVAGIQQQH